LRADRLDASQETGKFCHFPVDKGKGIELHQSADKITILTGLPMVVLR
jgi:hypothetical protein